LDEVFVLISNKLFEGGANMIIPTADPFYFPGNRIGCLLVHGFTGAPKEMRWMGEYLGEQGYTVMGIRLAGHATKIEDMMRMRWQDWLTSVEDGYCLLQGCVDQVFLIGLSMGGILSFLFASEHPVTGVVAMSTPYAFPDDPRLPFLNILSGLMPEVKKGASDWHNKEAGSIMSNVKFSHPWAHPATIPIGVSYGPPYPLVRAPVLIIHSKQDGSVAPHAEQIFAALGSQDKQIFWSREQSHVIPAN
jgi:carboxylesterase